MKSQKEQILARLQFGQSITPIQALELYGCFRLGARIYDLRKAGHNIVSTLAHNGKKQYSIYKLIKP
jgi:hypothetical protein